MQNCSNVWSLRLYTGSLYEEGCLRVMNNRFWQPWCSDPTPWVWRSSMPQRARHGRPHGGADRILRLQDDLLRWQPSELVMTPKDAGNDQLARLFPLLDATMVSQHNLSPAKRDERLRTMLNVADLAIGP